MKKVPTIYPLSLTVELNETKAFCGLWQIGNKLYRLSGNRVNPRCTLYSNEPVKTSLYIYRGKAVNGDE